MQVLREISTQTADATSNTSDAIAKLAQLSAALRKSVAGFRLPESPAAPAGSPRIPTLPDATSATGRLRRIASTGNG
jgi:twitching motility protein PilJ